MEPDNILIDMEPPQLRSINVAFNDGNLRDLVALLRNEYAMVRDQLNLQPTARPDLRAHKLARMATLGAALRAMQVALNEDEARTP